MLMKMIFDGFSFVLAHYKQAAVCHTGLKVVRRYSNSGNIAVFHITHSVLTDWFIVSKTVSFTLHPCLAMNSAIFLPLYIVHQRFSDSYFSYNTMIK